MIRYLAEVERGGDLGVFLAMGWEPDPSRLPTAWLIPLCWRRDWEPVLRPRGWRKVGAES